MGFTLQKKASAPINLYILNDRGRVIQQELDFRSLTTPRPERAALRLIGISEPFEQKDTFNGGMKTKVRGLFEVVEGVSRRKDVGKRFTENLTASLSAKSKLGQIWAVTMPPLEDGDEADPTGMLGKTFEAILSVNESTDDAGNVRYYTNLTDKTIRAISAADDDDEDEDDAVQAVTPAPAPAARRTVQASRRDEPEEEPPFDGDRAADPFDEDDDAV